VFLKKGIKRGGGKEIRVGVTSPSNKKEMEGGGEKTRGAPEVFEKGSKRLKMLKNEGKILGESQTNS